MATMGNSAPVRSPLPPTNLHLSIRFLFFLAMCVPSPGPHPTRSAVRDSLWNASCASPQRRQALVESWARSTLERASIDMSFAPPLIVAQIYNSRNFHWVLRLLLIAPTREYLCLKFDPLLDKPHIVGANKEELAVVDELAEREGIQPQPRRKWATFLDAFGSLAFAIAPLYSTFIRQDDFVNCHPACLLMLHCALQIASATG